MRATTFAAAVSAFAAAALLTGAGAAAAQPGGEGPAVDPDVPAGCVYIPTTAGPVRCMSLDPVRGAVAGSIGYGSLGTGSLMDLLSELINTGSVVLSVDVPNGTGVYAPGSLGSYGPEASLGEILLIPIGSLAGAS
ncbi:hypothetical protein [Dietzia sp. CH92]|uniref:hypothetical protein n=1 Tax=Dietzia sp. CH92 TaxID=3051823 RepID=UPI0028D62322|nr:hypothetical protein [Dietzia sp. CH92]